MIKYGHHGVSMIFFLSSKHDLKNLEPLRKNDLGNESRVQMSFNYKNKQCQKLCATDSLKERKALEKLHNSFLNPQCQ